MTNDFYVYLYLRKDGSPYYVGKGHKYRAYRTGCLKDRSRIQILQCPSEEVALEYEKLLIAAYGRKDLGTGILRNLTDGGEGATGTVWSMERRQKHSIAMKAAYQVLGAKENLSRVMKVRANLSAARAASFLPEAKVRRSAARSAALKRPEINEQFRAALKAAWARPDVRERHRINQAGQFQKKKVQ
jgi:hypothetical protein